MTDELVQVWRQPDGTWRWRYVVLDHTELRSNRGYESAVDAVRSARQAYPGVEVLAPVEGMPTGDGLRRRRTSLLRTALLSATAVFALLSAWYAARRLMEVRHGR